MKMIPSRNEQLVNPKTGEVVNTIALIPETRDKDFVKVFKLMTTKVIKDLKAGIDGAVFTLLWFIDRIQGLEPNQDPIVVVDPKDIAEDLGIGKRTVYYHLNLLKKHGYIEQIKNRQHIYRVNPMMIYKGTLKKYFDKQSDKKRKESKEVKEVEVEQAPCMSPDELPEAEEIEEEVEANVLSGLICLKSDKPKKKGKGKSVLLLE